MVVLGGPHAGDQSFARLLRRLVGLPVSSGQALAVGALLEACRDLLRWRGRDPCRVSAAILVDPEHPALGIATAEYVAGWSARLGVWGVDGPRRGKLAARLLATSGTVLETFPSLEACLAQTDFLIDGRGRGALPAVSGPGPAVIAALDSRPGRPGPGGEVLRLSVPGRVGPVPTGSGGWPPSGNSGAGDPLIVMGAFFAAPAGWTGRPEPCCFPGLLSPPLVEAVVAALGGARLLPGAPDVSARAISRLGRVAAALGFRPAAVLARSGRYQS